MTTKDRTSGYWRPELETAEPDERRRHLDARVAEIVAHAYANAPAFRAKMDSVGAQPGDVATVAGLSRLPLTEKADLVRLQRENLPFGGLIGESPEEFRRIYVSPGPIYEPGEKRFADDRWTQAFYAAGFRPGDIGQVTFNFNMVPFAFWLDSCLHQMGCRSVPAGVGNTELQVQILKELRVEAYLGTPSFLAALAEKAEGMGLDLQKDLNLQVGFVAAEMLPESLRADLESRLGMMIRQSYGTADVGCLSYECFHHDGMHFAQDCVVEVVDPETGQPMGEGEPGEVVATVFDKAYPLIRFGTGDLSAYVTGTCACGRTSPRLTRIMGRVDQVTKVKGMFIHPGGVGQVAQKFPQVAAYQLVVDREGHKDVMTLVCELADASAAGDAELLARMQAALKEILRVSGEVSFVARGTLPEGCKVIDDRRVWD
ncbi:MAG: AMP-binding protein [Deltaproteobacteria bacterium]|nr:AMP-binding protein [Deltaproteobacteria bacterium]